MSIWGSDVTIDRSHPAGAPFADCLDVNGHYAARDLVVTAKRDLEAWVDVATTPVCDMVRLIVGEASESGEVFLDEPQVRAIAERLQGWLGEVERRRQGSTW